MAVQPSQQLSMDAATQGGFIKYFSSLVEKPATTIRIFDRNDYYTVHGNDAIFTATEVFHTNSVIKNLGSGSFQLPSVILSKPNFESFVRDLLLVKQYRVEIYTCKVKSSNDWKLNYKASPGNLQQLEDVVFGRFDMSSSLIIMAVKLVTEGGKRQLGVAYAETASEVLGVVEFIEDDQFSNLEALIVQLRPKECLVIARDSNSDAQKLNQVLQRNEILVSERKRNEFSSSDIVEDLDRLLFLQSGERSSSLAEVDLKHAMSSLAAIIKYLDLLSDESNFGAYKISTFDFTLFLRLDSAAVKALHLEPQPGDPANSHLSGILDNCSSPQGKRLLQQWLRQPLLDRNKIEERLDLVEVCFCDLPLRHTLRDCLKVGPDYFRLAKKLTKGKGSLQDCVRVYQSVCRLPVMIKALSAHDGPKAQLVDSIFITPLTEMFEDFSEFIKMIEATVDMNLTANHEYVIKPSYDEDLLNLKNQMTNLESKINVEFKKASKELELEAHKAVKLEFTSQLGYFFRVTKKSEKCLRSRKHYIILEAHKDGVRFNTSLVDGLNEQYMSLKQEYSATQASLVTDVLHIAATYIEPMLTLNSTLAQLDVIVSFAHASAIAPLPYVRPSILPSGGNIILKGCRHPCLEIQGDISFVANDVSLLRDKESFQIITGPNMGGKSTYMRQVGVAVLMAQIGCYVPCASASISVVDSILARVGAGDSQLKGISTFMAEMLETTSIVKSATKNSLVIIDELGRGTSTYDGFGLAWAISEYIATEIQCFCLFATHFHELTLLAEEIPTVKNLHVTAHTSDHGLTLLYQVKPGACDRSFGLHVAELAQFPKDVIEYAQKKAAELEIWDPGTIKVSVKCDEDGIPAAKRSKLESDEGEKVMTNFLSAVGELANSEIEEEEMRAKFEQLQSDLLNTDKIIM